ncbi:MAG: 4Fe-4S binding protein [Thiobacillus sp.]
MATANSRPAKRGARLCPRAVWPLLVALMLLFGSIPNAGADISARYPQVRALFPDADRFGESEGDPTASAVYANEVLVGYAFLTADMAPIPAYSGSPINLLVGIDTSGRIVGARIVHHEEPILAAGISEARLAKFVDQYRGKPANGRISVGAAAREGYATVDTISGATISVMVINASITRAVRTVAASRGIGAQAASTAAPAPPSPAAAPAKAETPGETRTGEPPPDRSAAADARKAPTANRPVAPAGAPSRTPLEAGPAATPRLTAPPPPEAGVAEEPMWRTVWRQRKLDIALLGLGLVVLTCILLFQDYLARRPALLRWVRLGFLAYTLGFIGWYALGQLSIINVLTFIQAITRQFSWDSFLIDPMLFILWSFVAVTLLLWGRGVYCGWLCPFGALQELSFRLARRLKLPSFEIPHVVHERMLALKFVILLVLFALSLQSMGLAIRVAEVEPFKTAINFRFQREWGYVAFAVAILLLSTFNRKFYCKYVCPRGASRVFPGRFHSFEWLRRRKECGRPCQACAVECEVQAIRPTGEIVVNECHHCLDCQVTYYNDHKCPPLVEKRKRHERSSAREASGPGAAELARIPVSARPGRAAAGRIAEKPQAVDGDRMPLT